MKTNAALVLLAALFVALALWPLDVYEMGSADDEFAVGGRFVAAGLLAFAVGLLARSFGTLVIVAAIPAGAAVDRCGEYVAASDVVSRYCAGPLSQAAVIAVVGTAAAMLVGILVGRALEREAQRSLR